MNRQSMPTIQAAVSNCQLMWGRVSARQILGVGLVVFSHRFGLQAFAIRSLRTKALAIA